MKQFPSILILLVFANTLFAQDNIILRNGNEVKAKVQEVGTSEIKYKRSDNPSGPVYTIWKREVFMIQYENGTRDVFNNNQAQGPEFGFKDNGMHHGKTKLPQDYKGMRRLAHKRIAGGAVMIGVGAPMIIGGLALSGSALRKMNNNGYPYYDNGGNMQQFMAGALFTAGGIVLEVVGPITLKRGLKFRKMANEMKPATIGFTPIYNPGLDRCERGMNRQTVGAVTLTF